MQFTNPSLVLSYVKEGTTSTITNEYIIRDSIRISQQWLKDLSSSSNTCQLQLHRDCPDILDIIQYDDDIKAALYDGSSVIFTGYLSDGQSWSVNNSGEKALTISIEDIGTRLLPKAYIRTGAKVVLKGAADTVVRQICEACGVVMDLGFPVINTQVLKVVEVGEKCQDLLKQLMKEVGYAYYFTNEGKLSARKIDCTDVEDIPVLNKDDLYVYNNNGITLTKKMRQYKSAKVTFNTVGKRYETLIYKDISGQDDSHPNCNIELERGQTYPDPDGAVAYVTAEDLMSGNEVVYIENVVPEVEISTKGAVVESEIKLFEADTGIFSADTLSVLLTCVSTGEDPNKAVVSKLQAKADLTYIEAKNDVIAGEVASSDASNTMYEEECEWIHDLEDAKVYANLFVNYYKYCSRQFQFFAKTDIECGAVVRIWDDVHSGLSVPVMVIGKSYGDTIDTIKYTALSVDEFDFTLPTTSTKIYAAPSSVNVNPSGGVSTFFDVNISSGIYKRNSRKASNQELLVTVSINGYTETSASVTVSDGSFSNTEDIKTITIGLNEVKTLYIPYDNSYDTISVRGLLNAATEVRKVIPAVNETAQWAYLGALTSLPTPSDYGYDRFAIGDHFLAAADFTEDSKSYSSGDCYFWDGEGWPLATSSTVEIDGVSLGVEFYVTAMSNCLNDAVDVPTPATSQLGSWVKRLSAKEVVASEIFSKSITMTKNGSIQSEQYAESEGYPTSGYKLSSNDGTLKAMNAMLRDVNIKCTDNEGDPEDNFVLLQTQRYQAGASNISVKNSNLAARWCIDDAESSITLDKMVACTYNGNSRYIWRPKNTQYTAGYRHLIGEVWLSSGGHTHHEGWRYGECLYTFPIPGNYYAVIHGYTNVAYPGYLIDPNGRGVTSNVGTMYVDLGYKSANSQILFLYCNSAEIYLYDEERQYEICTKNDVTYTYTGNWGGYTTSATFGGNSYIPEIFISNGSIMGVPLTVGNFDSDNYKYYHALSDTLASWAEGSYNVTGSVTGGSDTLPVVNIGKTSGTISFRDDDYRIITITLPIDTNPVAITGWCKNLDGTINLISQQSGILTYNVLPSINQQCSCGTTGQAWGEVVSYGFNSLSSRAEKKNIHKYEDNATDIINDTEIVSFNYKNKKDESLRVGFIADDTNSLMAGTEHNIYDLNNCVGLLLKAVQELSARLDKLEK